MNITDTKQLNSSGSTNAKVLQISLTVTAYSTHFQMNTTVNTQMKQIKQTSNIVFIHLRSLCEEALTAKIEHAKYITTD